MSKYKVEDIVNVTLYDEGNFKRIVYLSSRSGSYYPFKIIGINDTRYFLLVPDGAQLDGKLIDGGYKIDNYYPFIDKKYYGQKTYYTYEEHILGLVNKQKCSCINKLNKKMVKNYV